MLIYDRYNGLPIDEPNSYYLYVFRRESDGYTKIGITDNPRRRVREIAVNCGSHLRPVLFLNVRDESLARILEKELHDAYKSINKWTLGEWFNMSIASLMDFQTLAFSMYFVSYLEDPTSLLTELYGSWHLCSLEKVWMEQFDGSQENLDQRIDDLMDDIYNKGESITNRYLSNCIYRNNTLKNKIEILGKAFKKVNAFLDACPPEERSALVARYLDKT